jgi:pimeloyl-ACP methyl ester carboxylesterase
MNNACESRSPIRVFQMRRLHCGFVLCLLIQLVAAGRAQNPVSRPILFAHGWCGSALDFDPLFNPATEPLFSQLPRDLYPIDNLYAIEYNTVSQKAVYYSITVNANGSETVKQINPSTIPAEARFFTIAFYDPVGKTVSPADVAKISILNKAYEVSKVVKLITAITQQPQVIVIGHSMGGLDARAYVENMASAGACYNYSADQPDYSAATCTPGASDAAYAGDVGDIISVDTPHAGTPLAELSFVEREALVTSPQSSSLGCIAGSSTNKTELEPLPGGSGLIESLNYNGDTIAGALPTENGTPMQAVQDYFNNVTKAWDGLQGYSDDIVTDTSQSIVQNLPAANTTAPLLDVPVGYASTDSGIKNTPDCFVSFILFKEPVLHFMGCLGAQPDTQNAIAAEVNANVE